ncbi:MAG: ELWxxDGT repeat protein [Bacteroidota bacterium]
MIKRLHFILFVLLPFAASAQVSILKDINLNSSTGGSSPNGLTPFNGMMFYAATDGVTGVELWKSDGTVGNTTLVKDIYPGDGSSSPNSFVVIGSTMYFSANDGEHGTELWKTDGTTAGTVIVSDVAPGTDNSNPYYLVNVNNAALYFSADDGVHGREPWKYDIASGTASMIFDINQTGSNGSSPTELTYVSGTTVYFAATDDATATELWKTDGTTTTRIKDIAAGTNSSDPYNLRKLANNYVVFVADDGTTGPELYVCTNGTSAGTSLLKQINTNGTGSYPSGEFPQLGSYVYFSAYSPTSGYEVWRTDGTTAGTAQVSELAATTTSSSPTFFTLFNSAIYFAATDGGLTNGNELWRTTGGAPTLIANINAGTTSSNPRYLTVFNGNLYVQATTAANGSELFRCTTGSVITPFDILSGTNSSNPANLTALGTTALFFSANDGTGSELWKFNGTAASQVVDLVTGTAGGTPTSFVAYNTSTVLFAADDGSGQDLWKTNGTTGGTVAFAPGGIINTVATNSAQIQNMTLVGTNAYFSGTDGGGDTELWRYDGTNVTKIDIVAGASGSFPNQLFAMNATTLLFSAYSAAGGYELYKAVNGVVSLVKDIDAGTGSSSPQAFMKTSGGAVYFRAYTAALGYELYKYDGVSTVTLVPQAEAGSGSTYPQYMTELNGNIYFEGNSTATNGYELWKYDGVSTTLVKDINSTGQGIPQLLTVFNGDLYFRAASSGTNYELFKMLGSNEKVGLAKEINPGSDASNPSNFTLFNGRLYFQANDGTHGTELWTVDPTTGVTLFKDMNPGGAPGGFSNAVVSGTKMYFVGAGPTGVDVWVTDGTTCSTIAVPYATQSAGANSITPIGTKFVFSMIAQGTGSELFLLDPAAITFPVPVSINTHPQGQSVNIFSPVSFTVAATGSALTYQWQKNSVNIGGATSNTYNIASVADTDAADYRVIVTGTCGPVTSNTATLIVNGSTPSAQPTGFTVSNPTPTSLGISFTASIPGSSGYIALRKKGSAPTETPVDGTVYTAGATLGASVVAKASATISFTDPGLDNSSEYFYTIFSYNGGGTLIKYLATSPLSGSGITISPEPVEQPTNLAFTNLASNTLTVSYTAAASGGTYLVIRKVDSNPTAVPADGVIYSAGATLGDAVVAYYGDALTFNEAGLSATTNYYYQVFFARGVNATVNYNQVNPLQGNVTTLIVAPDKPTAFKFSNQTQNSFTVAFTPPASGADGYLVLRNAGRTLTAVPADGITYTLGQTVGDSRVAYIGTAFTFDESIPLLQYTYAVFPYNGSAGSTNYNTDTPLTGFIAPDATAPVVTSATDKTIGSGSPVIIKATVVEDESSLQDVTVEYKAIASASAPTSVIMTLVGSQYQFPIPAAEITHGLGVQYTITATNTMGLSQSKSDKVSITFNNQPFNTNSHGSNVSNYRIIAIPLDLPEKSVNSIFVDDLGPYDGV